MTLSEGWVRACVASNGMNSGRSRGSCRTVGSSGGFGGTARSVLSRAGVWPGWYVVALGRFSCDLHSESATTQETYNSIPRHDAENQDPTMYAYKFEAACSAPGCREKRRRTPPVELGLPLPPTTTRSRCGSAVDTFQRPSAGVLSAC